MAHDANGARGRTEVGAAGTGGGGRSRRAVRCWRRALCAGPWRGDGGCKGALAPAAAAIAVFAALAMAEVLAPLQPRGGRDRAGCAMRRRGSRP